MLKKHYYFLINYIFLIPEIKMTGDNAELSRLPEKISNHAKK